MSNIKKITLLILLLSATLHSFGQNKKAVIKNKNPKAKTEIQKTSKNEEIEKVNNEFENFNSVTAGRFAKSMANKMYKTSNMYGEYKTAFSCNLLGWKATKLNENKIYLVQVELSWKEGNGGIFNDWWNYSYKGVMMFDEFGCKDFFMLYYKDESSILGLRKRCADIESDTKQILNALDEWTKDVKYVWTPEGCLDE